MSGSMSSGIVIFKNSVLVFFTLILVSCSENHEVGQWRGPERNGIYPQTNLLKQWSDDGPKMKWSFEGLGAGHGSVSVADDQLFVLGMPDTMGVIYSFDINGELLWQKEYGLEWYRSYTGTRSSPTITDGLLYFVSGQGEAFCMETETGELIWSVDMFEKFDAQEITWGIAESPLLDGDKIILTPGGIEHNVVALDRFTGETIWTSKGNSDASAYCSPILVQHNETSFIITMTSESILGIDAKTGQSYWRIEHRQRNMINANSPVYHNGMVFCASDRADTNHGHIMIQLSEDGKEAEIGWRNEERFNLIGGIIYREGYIYSSTYNKNEWFCLDAETGKLQYVSDKVRGGAIIYADSLFYNYGMDGIMSLLEVDENDINLISSFEVPLGADQHWAHPVIYKGDLFLRHGNALMCYDIALNK